MVSTLPTVSVPRVPTLVVVPHPDDEVLLFGGLIARQRSRSVPVTVLAVTDGEAGNRPHDDAVALAELRRREQHEACVELGVPAPAVLRLGLPDGGVGPSGENLRSAVARLAPEHGLVVAPWSKDGHADHDACGAVVDEVTESTDTVVFRGLFWAWHRDDRVPLPTEHMRRIGLTADERETRWRALARHRSQITGDVSPRLLGDELLWPLDLDECYVTRSVR